MPSWLGKMFLRRISLTHIICIVYVLLLESIMRSAEHNIGFLGGPR